jgi:hypothetical protein
VTPVVSWLRRHGESLLAPVAGAALYAALVSTAGAGAVASVIAALFFIGVLMMYLGLRRLRVHASASRLASIGDPDQLLALVERELPRRLLTGTRMPLYIFRAMAYNLLGNWDRARQALNDAGIRPGQRSTRSWHLVWAAADIHTRTGSGDAIGARQSYVALVMPFRRLVPAAGVELIAIECEARILLAEGNPAAARVCITPLIKDIRLGAGVRAQLRAILAQAAAAEGDVAGAAEHAAAARKLAPKCPEVPRSAQTLPISPRRDCRG